MVPKGLKEIMEHNSKVISVIGPEFRSVIVRFLRLPLSWSWRWW